MRSDPRNRRSWAQKAASREIFGRQEMRRIIGACGAAPRYASVPPLVARGTRAPTPGIDEPLERHTHGASQPDHATPEQGRRQSGLPVRQRQEVQAVLHAPRADPLVPRDQAGRSRKSRVVRPSSADRSAARRGRSAARGPVDRFVGSHGGSGSPQSASAPTPTEPFSPPISTWWITLPPALSPSQTPWIHRPVIVVGGSVWP